MLLMQSFIPSNISSKINSATNLSESLSMFSKAVVNNPEIPIKCFKQGNNTTSSYFQKTTQTTVWKISLK